MNTTIITFFVIYGFILIGVVMQENYYNWYLASFDLISDGSFSATEQTPEQKLAMQKVVADTGRTFAIITGLFYAAFIAIITLFVSLIFEKFKPVK